MGKGEGWGEGAGTIGYGKGQGKGEGHGSGRDEWEQGTFSCLASPGTCKHTALNPLIIENFL